MDLAEKYLNTIQSKKYLLEKDNSPNPVFMGVTVGTTSAVVGTTIKNMMKPESTEVVGTVVGAGALIYLAYQVYKNYLSKAARSCSSKSGSDKDKCIEKYHNDSLRKEKEILQRLSSKCSNTKEPGQCKNIIKKRIAEIQNRMK